MKVQSFRESSRNRVTRFLATSCLTPGTRCFCSDVQCHAQTNGFGAAMIPGCCAALWMILICVSHRAQSGRNIL